MPRYEVMDGGGFVERVVGGLYHQVVPPNVPVVIDLHKCRPRSYETYVDAIAVVDWLNDRTRGYPSLQRFEGGANWPIVAADQRCALWAAR